MLPSFRIVQILEVRFYPRTKAVPTFVVVGKVLCNRDTATVEVAPIRSRAVEPFNSAGLLTKVQFLVDAAVPEPAPELLRLRSDFWAFVELDQSERDGSA